MNCVFQLDWPAGSLAAVPEAPNLKAAGKSNFNLKGL